MSINTDQDVPWFGGRVNNTLQVTEVGSNMPCRRFVWSLSFILLHSIHKHQELILQVRSRMSKLLNYFSKSIRNCLSCSSFRIDESGLCGKCRQRLSELKSLKNKTNLKGLGDNSLEGNLMVRELFLWNPGQSDSLSKLILHLKGDQEERLWQYWAEQFLIHHPELLKCRLGGLVPAPSSGPYRMHATLFAKALAMHLDCPVLEILEMKTVDGHQREKSRAERLDRDVKLVDKEGKQFIALEGDYRNLVLVDDVLTTGSTVRACWRAMGSPRGFQAWVLARRTLQT